VAVTGKRRSYLAMLTPSGDLDTSFGDGGVVRGYIEQSAPLDIVIDAEDRVITANGREAVIQFLA
jgi:hypothetical protein